MLFRLLPEQSVRRKLDAGRLEVLCVGYHLFAAHVDTLAAYEWRVVVFDEVHWIKNPKSQRW